MLPSLTALIPGDAPQTESPLIHEAAGPLGGAISVIVHNQHNDPDLINKAGNTRIYRESAAYAASKFGRYIMVTIESGMRFAAAFDYALSHLLYQAATERKDGRDWVGLFSTALRKSLEVQQRDNSPKARQVQPYLDALGRAETDAIAKADLLDALQQAEKSAAAMRRNPALVPSPPTSDDED